MQNANKKQAITHAKRNKQSIRVGVKTDAGVLVFGTVEMRRVGEHRRGGGAVVGRVAASAVRVRIRGRRGGRGGRARRVRRAAALVVEVPVEAAERAVVGALALEEQLALFGAEIAQVSMQ